MGHPDKRRWAFLLPNVCRFESRPGLSTSPAVTAFATEAPSKMEALPNRIETGEVSQMNQIQKKGKNKIAPEFQCPIPMESLQKKNKWLWWAGRCGQVNFWYVTNCNETYRIWSLIPRHLSSLIHSILNALYDELQVCSGMGYSLHSFRSHSHLSEPWHLTSDHLPYSHWYFCCCGSHWLFNNDWTWLNKIWQTNGSCIKFPTVIQSKSPFFKGHLSQSLDIKKDLWGFNETPRGSSRESQNLQLVLWLISSSLTSMEHSTEAWSCLPTANPPKKTSSKGGKTTKIKNKHLLYIGFIVFYFFLGGKVGMISFSTFFSTRISITDHQKWQRCEFPTLRSHRPRLMAPKPQSCAVL